MLGRRQAVALGLVLMGIAAIVCAFFIDEHRGYRTPSAFGVVPGATASASSSALASATSSASPSVPLRHAKPVRASTNSTTARTTSGPAPSSAAPGAAPMRLVIPDLHVDAPVVPVGETDGALDIPEDVQTLGWWRGSAEPGSPGGSTLLAGHVDSHILGTGALFHLDTLQQGAMVVVTTPIGQVQYRVVARRIYLKSAGLPADLFRTTGSARLVLVTCGGPFVPNASAPGGNYLDNVVVYAVPI